ncbi:MAG: hypothetical protein P4M00_16605 [Azospirillaceae bacterium]|nr:hypothetical protein [Azospirillaceae bacterium]
MPFSFAKNTATAETLCTVEDALPLLEYLQSHRGAKVDLGPCRHLHTAVLQVLLAARPKITVLPQDPVLSGLLSQALGASGEKETK